MPLQYSRRWGTDDGSVTWDTACKTDITGVETTDKKVLFFQIARIGEHGSKKSNKSSPDQSTMDSLYSQSNR